MRKFQNTILLLMSTSTTDTQSLSACQLYIKRELLSTISKMHHYLGTIDYNTQFYRRKRGTQANNWEFEDDDTKSVFEAMIIGEVADPRFGTLLKGKGNYKPPKSDPVRRPNLLQYTQIKHNLVEPSFERKIQYQKHHCPPKLN